MGFGGGGSIQADSHRSAIPGVFGIAQHNIGIVNKNLSRQLKELHGNLIRTTSTQKAQAAGTGFSVSSKSFRSIENETMQVIISQANDLRENAELERQKIWYEAQVQAVQLENQARASEVAARAQRQQATGAAITRIVSLFGGGR